MPLPELYKNIDWSKQKVVSYSQYSMYNQCQYQWYLTYVKKHKVFTPSIYLTWGTSMHEVLQNYLQLLFNESAKKADSINFAEELKVRMYENYKKDLETNKGIHFIKQSDFTEFIDDGVQILEWLRKKRTTYFTTKKHTLVGIEVAIQDPIVEGIPNVLMIGAIDLIIKDERDDSYIVYDIKTSTRGWKDDKEKKDPLKINQVLLYKRFYSKKLGVTEDKIKVQFFILKRKIFEGGDFPAKRIQEFIPAQGKKKVQDAFNSLHDFVSNSFTADAQYNESRTYEKNFSACKYCAFKDKPELCSKDK